MVIALVMDAPFAVLEKTVMESFIRGFPGQCVDGMYAVWL
jgi:hypothetical protein